MLEFFSQSTQTSAPKNQNNSELCISQVPAQCSFPTCPYSFLLSLLTKWLFGTLSKFKLPFKIIFEHIHSKLEGFKFKFNVFIIQFYEWWLVGFHQFYEWCGFEAIVMDWKSMNGIPWILRWNKVHPKKSFIVLFYHDV